MDGLWGINAQILWLSRLNLGSLAILQMAMLALYTRNFLSGVNPYSRLLDEISERS